MPSKTRTKTEEAIIKAAYAWYEWYDNGGMQESQDSGCTLRLALSLAIEKDKRARQKGNKE